MWQNGFFKKTTLHKLGLRLQLNHANGRPCPCPTAPTLFTMLHTNGIHHVNVDFCGCEKQVPKRIQLLRLELYPATSRNPCTAATMRLLETFEKLVASGKTSAYEHYKSLERMTDNTGLTVPKVLFHKTLDQKSSCYCRPDTNLICE